MQIAAIGGKTLHVEFVKTTMCANLRNGDGLKKMFVHLKSGDGTRMMCANFRTGDDPKTMFRASQDWRRSENNVRAPQD